MKELDQGRKGERKTYCMCTAIHIISATDLPNKHSCAQAREGRAPGALSIKKNDCAFGRPAKEQVVTTTERKSC